MKPNDIICPTCGEFCGKRYPSTFEDPGFCEGIGENFVLDMVWHCSQNCLDQANYEKSLPTEPSHRECSACGATIPHPGDSLCKAREVRKQCVCGHTWIGTIQDENCPRCSCEFGKPQANGPAPRETVWIDPRTGDACKRCGGTGKMPPWPGSNGLVACGVCREHSKQ
jgi:hypothetical protein